METDRLKVINRDMMKYIAIIPMVIGHNSKARFIWFFVSVFCLNFILNGLVLSTTFWIGLLLQLLAYFLMVKCYNGKRGKHPNVEKWFFYIFYPMLL